MPVKLVYPGASKPRLWARDHWCIRLYDRRAVRFRASAVHDLVVTGSHRYGKLQAPLHHFSMRSFDDMKRKLNERTWLSVEHAEPLSSIGLVPRLMTEMPMNFLKYYITRRHFTGGVMGLRYAAIQSWYRFLKIYRVWRERMFGGRALTVGQAPNERRETASTQDDGLPRNDGEFKHKIDVARERDRCAGCVAPSRTQVNRQPSSASIDIHPRITLATPPRAAKTAVQCPKPRS